MNTIQFEDVTQNLSVISEGESYGAAWGDFNGDGWVDLWSPNHHDPGNLFINDRSGRFNEQASALLATPKNVDPHGSAWADFDNDGDQDLSQSIGGAFGADVAKVNSSYFNQLFVNQNGQLRDQARRLGVSDPGGRGRSPLWVDFNHDGRLDLILTNGVKDLESVPRSEQPPTQVYQQKTQGSGFINVTEQSGINFDHARYGTLADLNNDGNLDLVFPSISRVFDITEFPFRDITSELFSDGKIPRHRDIAVADFNGDLKTDLFLAREDLSSDYFQSSPQDAQVIFRQGRGQEAGASFKTEAPGAVTFRLRSPHFNFRLDPSEIFIGSRGSQPQRFRQNESFIEFTLNADNQFHQGIKTHTPGNQNGVYVGFDRASQTWEIFWSNGRRNSTVVQPIALISSSTELSDLTPINFTATRDRRSNKNLLLFNQGAGKPFLSQPAGGTVPGSASSVVAADFDNDRDVDVFVVNTGAIANIPNTYYENQGDGQFRVREDLGATAGNEIGIGETVVAADYDQDGFIDLYVTNGRNILGPWFHEGSSSPQLLKNQGNDNNWLQLDLIGTVSNRDGIGSRVVLTSNGVKQVREQNNGSHTFAQNDRRIHFGLGRHRLVRKLEISWPSGMRQTLHDIDINQILTITEGQGRNQSDIIIGSDREDVIRGRGGNDQLSGGQKNDQIFGGSGNDTLEGNGGNDTLTGQQGSDVLVGGRGSDIFRLDSAVGVDTIQDFTVTQDTLQIDQRLILNHLDPGSINSQIFQRGTQAQSAEVRFLYSPVSGELKFDINGSETGGETLLATIENKPALSFSNIQVV